MTSYAVKRDDGAWWHGAGWITIASARQTYGTMTEAVLSLELAGEDGEWKVVAV